MITETRTCHECQSPQIVRNGKNRVGNQRYKCKNCGVTRVLDSRLPTRQLDPAALARSYLERQSLRATGRIFGMSHVTVLHHLKKKRAPR
jgi:transposase-like protein